MPAMDSQAPVSPAQYCSPSSRLGDAQILAGAIPGFSKQSCSYRKLTDICFSPPRLLPLHSLDHVFGRNSKILDRR